MPDTLPTFVDLNDDQAGGRACVVCNINYTQSAAPAHMYVGRTVAGRRVKACNDTAHGRGCAYLLGFSRHGRARLLRGCER